MDIYNSYLIGLDRELAIEEAEMSMVMHKLLTMYEEVERNLSIMREQAELKVFKESGSYDDLAYLYTEAENEANQQKEGLLSKISGVIKKIWNGISGFISKIFSKADEKPNDDVEVPETLEEDSRNILTFWKNMKAGISKIQSGEKGGSKDIIMGLAIPALTIIGGAVVGKKLIKMKLSKVRKISENTQGVGKEMTGMIDNLMNKLKNSKLLSPVMNKLQQFSNRVKSWITKVTGFLTGADKATADQVRNDHQNAINNQVDDTMKKNSVLSAQMKSGMINKGLGEESQKDNIKEHNKKIQSINSEYEDKLKEAERNDKKYKVPRAIAKGVASLKNRKKNKNEDENVDESVVDWISTKIGEMGYESASIFEKPIENLFGISLDAFSESEICDFDDFMSDYATEQVNAMLSEL